MLAPAPSTLFPSLNCPVLTPFRYLLELLENFCQKVLETQGDVAVAVVIVLLEDIGHALERDAALNEQVEAHDAFISLVVGVENQFDKLGA